MFVVGFSHHRSHSVQSRLPFCMGTYHSCRNAEGREKWEITGSKFKARLVEDWLNEGVIRLQIIVHFIRLIELRGSYLTVGTQWTNGSFMIIIIIVIIWKIYCQLWFFIIIIDMCMWKVWWELWRGTEWISLTWTPLFSLSHFHTHAHTQHNTCLWVTIYIYMKINTFNTFIYTNTKSAKRQTIHLLYI